MSADTTPGDGSDPTATSARAAPSGDIGTVSFQSVRAVAKKDFQDSIRSWLFLFLSVFFFSILVFPTVLLWYLGGDAPTAEATTAGLVGTVHEVTRLVIPVIALVLGWKAIAGERETGSLKVLLSLPHSRTDVLLGKFVGRSAVLSLSLFVGFFLAAFVVAILFGGFDLADYVGLFAVSVLYGLAYTSIAIGLSSLTRSTTIAGALAFGVFVLFYVVWETMLVAVDTLVQLDYLPGVEYTVTGPGGDQIALERPHDIAFLFHSFDPGVAYRSVLSFVTSVAEQDPGVVQSMEEAFGGSVPLFLQDWFAIVVLLFWIVVPLAVAIYWFQWVDL
ncbi:ABC transporter permease [Halobiforma nitratireducens]|uniref:ABC transporter n=1 Tax=Halobiforma nitratireducens JCM 10879 TaxID=1227454 RepID=M0LWA6_9EURY|nr:ABC transporter permease [Halobiforma nitratireducens]EMA37862.1 ABC transporter [Halobiforma nitratireducens JCM 10879]